MDVDQSPLKAQTRDCGITDNSRPCFFAPRHHVMRLNLSQTIIDYLRSHPEEKFTARYMAQWVFDNFPNECQAKKQRSKFIATDAHLIEQLVSEIGAHHGWLQKKYSQLKTTESRPRKYFWSEQSDAQAVAAATTDKTPSREFELYPLLSRYLWQEFGLYARRIDEKRASNRRGQGGNHWLYPDMVAMEDLGAHWHREVRDCVRHASERRGRLRSSASSTAPMYASVFFRRYPTPLGLILAGW